MHLFPKTHVDFLGMRWKFFALSALLLGGSVVSLATRGVKYGIDFTGGTTIQLSFDKPVELSKLRDACDKIGWTNAGLQTFTGTERPTYSIRAQADPKQSTAEGLENQLKDLQSKLPDAPFKVESKSYVGPSVSHDLSRKAMWAIVLSLSGIIAYLAFRFANPVWGVAGIIALFHDVLATYGLFSILGKEVDLLIISAILTIGGYSIHDTIVIFDRMREKMKIMRRDPLAQVMNESMNETLSRTIITSGTVLVVVTILYFLGGEVIHSFAMAMVFGGIVGTYSSIAVAAPLVYEWTMRNGGGRAVEAPAAQNRPKAANKR
jgi:preprotein translocase subunit SecF